MKTLIVYCSNHGTTEKCAKLIKDRLEGDVDLFNLKSTSNIKTNEYDSIIIGCSIHAGSIQKKVQNFIRNNEQVLLNKNIALFKCCGQEENVNQYFKTVFPKNILEHALVAVHLGYAYNFEKMGVITKTIIKKVANIHKSEEKIKYNNIDIIAQKVNQLKGK